jgi:hypothetical protein
MLAAGVAVPLTGVSAQTPPVRLAKSGVCYGEAKPLTDGRVVKVGEKIRAPKKTRHVWPKWPELPAGTTATTVWMGEALIDTEGDVVRVWTIREIELTPPFPPLNESIVDAIRQWKFDPLKIGGEPRPFCMAVTTNINWP